MVDLPINLRKCHPRMTSRICPLIRATAKAIRIKGLLSPTIRTLLVLFHRMLLVVHRHSSRRVIMAQAPSMISLEIFQTSRPRSKMRRRSSSGLSRTASNNSLLPCSLHHSSKHLRNSVVLLPRTTTLALHEAATTFSTSWALNRNHSLSLSNSNSSHLPDKDLSLNRT